MTVPLLAAIGTGILIAVQAAIIGEFGARLHPFTGAVWVHVGGLAFGLLVVAVMPALSFELGAVRQAPWGLLAGVAGVLLVTGIAIAVGGLGLGVTLAIVTGVQLLLSFAIEAAGLAGPRVPFDWVRVVGVLLIVGGVLLIFGRTTPASG